MSQQIIERFDALTQREKIIVGITLLATIWGCLDAFFIAPTEKKRQHLEQQLSSTQLQLNAVQSAVQQLKKGHLVDPNQQNREKLDAIKNAIANLREQINIGEKKFVTPQLMTTALRDVLKHHQLKLLKLETLPVTNLLNTEQQYSWVFRHGLTMTFSGSYFATLQYLQSLESLPWRFYWDNISYQVKEYPLAEVTIQVYTLSFHEEWLGV
jgi:MSHA biogenesis protein MshJ